MLDAHRWRQIESVFLEAADLAPEELGPFLDSACESDPELRAQVESLLANDDAGDANIRHALSEEAARTLEGPVLQGDRLGAYRVQHEIGRGGMGAVYLATRDDDQFQKQVALKVVRRGMDTADMLRRFRHERQILATLDHPYIARLIDGGSTRDGRPFLVMELVEGQAIDRYAKGKNLGIDERLRLFLSVCEAVSYAHRKLVIHRDLKPANILIAPAGTPKLLDFGLAKILDPESDAGLTGGARTRPFTPAYASPEQIRGATLSTSTDIYSLGVILFELLAGARPMRADNAELPGPASASPRPSEAVGTALPARWRKALHGDLDTIVMTAMHPEIERRYASVADIAADIRRHLAFEPILARPDSLRYRALKFARRRRLPVAAGVAILASLVGGMLVAVTQAREAESARRVAEAHERESLRARQTAEAQHKFAEKERDLALSASRISEDRLAQIVGLSDRSVSEVYSLLERLPGAVPARHELIHTTLEYLEKLAPEAAANPKLQVALAKAYLGLGELQFNPNMDVDGAEKSYRKGLTFVADAPGAHPHDAERIAVWLRIQNRLGEMLGRRDEIAAEVALLQRTLEATSQLPAEVAADRDVARNRANSYLLLARCGWPDFGRAREYSFNYLNAVNRLAQRFPSEPDFQFDRSVAMTAVGWTAIHLDDPESAAAYYEEAVRIREKLAQDYPADATFRGALMLSYVHLGSLQGGPLEANLGRPELALQYYLKARPLEEAAASDPKDIVAQASYAAFLVRLGALDMPEQNAAGPLATLRKAASILEPIISGSPTYRIDLCNADVWIGHRLAALGYYAESGAAYNRAAKLANGILAAAPEHADALARVLEAERGMARALMLAGDRAGAKDRATETVRRSEEGARRHRDSAFWKLSVAEAYLTLATIHKTFEEWGEANAAAQRALETAAPLTTGRIWDPNGRIAREARALLGDVAR